MKALDYGKQYRYAHNEPEAYAVDENYFPEQLTGREYYHPVPRGLEIKIAEKLKHLKSLDNKSKWTIRKIYQTKIYLDLNDKIH